MKKLLFLIALSLVMVSCTSDNVVTEVINTCGAQNLNINQMNKFSSVYVLPNGEISPSSSNRWYWRVYHDTIEISGNTTAFGTPPTTSYLFFKKNKPCIDFLSTRDVMIDDHGWTFDANGNVITHGFSWENFNNLTFKLQKYKEDEVLIGEITGMKYFQNVSIKFWLEFTPDTHDAYVPGYLTYYHP